MPMGQDWRRLIDDEIFARGEPRKWGAAPRCRCRPRDAEDAMISARKSQACTGLPRPCRLMIRF